MLWLLLGCGETPAVDDVVMAGDPSADRDGDGYDADVDCNDLDAAISPGASEICNGLDDDCDGSGDEELFGTWYRDADGDGFGTGDGVSSCTAVQGYAAVAGDCDDADGTIHPDAGERCEPYNTDDDCDGLIDEDDDDLTEVRYVDSDGDGWGDPDTAVASCDASLVTRAEDCDDSDAQVSPDAPEACDAAQVDEDCDGWANDADPEGPETNLASREDVDGDGFAADDSRGLCEADIVVPLGDCDDNEPAAAPGLYEICGDSIDNDCDGRADECDTLSTLTPTAAEHEVRGVATWEVLGLSMEASHDLDSDGIIDIAASVGGQQAVLLDLDADGTYTTEAKATIEGTWELPAAGPLGAVDANQDGTSDLYVGSRGAVLLMAGPWSGDRSTEGADDVLVHDGDDTFGRLFDAGSDGLVVAPSATMSLYRFEHGAQTDEEHALFVQSGSTWAQAAGWAGDLTGDGIDDVVAGIPWGFDSEYQGVVIVFDGTLEGSVAYDDADVVLSSTTDMEGLGFGVAALGDVDDDGAPDLGVGSQLLDADDGMAYVFAGPLTEDVDTGSAHLRIDDALGSPASTSMTSGDIDGDSFDDLVVGWPDSDRVSVFLGPVPSGTLQADEGRRVIQGTAVGQLGTTVAVLEGTDNKLLVAAPLYQLVGLTGAQGSIFTFDGGLF